MQVQGTVVIGDEKSLAVPTDCIVSAEGKDYIFILKEDHKVHGSEPKEADTHSHEDHADHNHGEVGNEYERVPVVKGVSSRGYTAITPIKELDEHTKIVQKGAFFLLAKMTNSGEHSH